MKPAPRQAQAWIVMVILAAVGAALRVLAAQGDLWLDEVWSIGNLDALTSPWEVLTKLHHDNNHVLNSWCIWFMRGIEPEWLIRLPAVIAGTASVGLAWWLVSSLLGGDPEDEVAATRAGFGGALAALLVAGAYPWVLYGSEARGYAFAVAAALAAAAILAQGTASVGGAASPSRWAWRVTFWIACAVGVLAHPIFLAQALAPLMIWIAARSWRKAGETHAETGRHALSGRRTIRWLLEVVGWCAAPLLFALWFFQAFLSKIQQGGGTASDWMRGISNAAGLALGIPVGAGDLGDATLRIAALAAVAGGSAWVLWRRGGASGRWALLLYCLTIPFGVALQLALSRPAFLYERYLLISLSFMTLMPVHAMTLAFFPSAQDQAEGRGRGRVTAILALVLVMVVGHAWSLTGLFASGRGRYRDALFFMIEHSPKGSITVAGDHDLRVKAMVVHYRTTMPGGNRIVYFAQNRLPADGVRWYLIHSPTSPTPPGPVFRDAVHGHRYALRATFNTGSLSGFHWFVFEREDLP